MDKNNFKELQEIQGTLDTLLKDLTHKDKTQLIEWDIALEKTRLLYEILTDIKLSIMSQSVSNDTKKNIDQNQEEEKPEEFTKNEEEEILDFVSENTDTKEEVFIEEEPIKEPIVTPEIKENTYDDSDNKSLNDILVDIENNMDLATHLQNSPIENLESAIALNDKIWFIRELFNGDNELYNSTIQRINKASSIDKAIQIIQNLSWDKEKSSTQKFFELIYRKFIR